jgi:hypothetical protein
MQRQPVASDESLGSGETNSAINTDSSQLVSGKEIGGKIYTMSY